MYYIYNETDYMLSIYDIHTFPDSEACAGGSVGIGDMFKIAPHSWTTTRKCNEGDVEKSLSDGALYRLKNKKQIKVCEKEEYQEEMIKMKNNNIERDIGFEGHNEVPENNFGFLSKAIKKDNNVFDFSSILLTDEEDEVVEEKVDNTPDNTNDRIAVLEQSVSNINNVLEKLVGLMQEKPKAKSSKKVVKKTSKKK